MGTKLQAEAVIYHGAAFVCLQDRFSTGAVKTCFDTLVCSNKQFSLINEVKVTTVKTCLPFKYPETI